MLVQFFLFLAYILFSFCCANGEGIIKGRRNLLKMSLLKRRLKLKGKKKTNNKRLNLWSFLEWFWFMSLGILEYLKFCCLWVYLKYFCWICRLPVIEFLSCFMFLSLWAKLEKLQFCNFRIVLIAFGKIEKGNVTKNGEIKGVPNEGLLIL